MPLRLLRRWRSDRWREPERTDRTADFGTGLRKVSESLQHFVWLLNRMPAAIPPALVRSEAAPVADDLPLVERVMSAYKVAAGEFVASSGGWDTALFAVKQEVHRALLGSDLDAAAAVLRNPAANTFFWGFDAIASSPEGEPEPHELVLRRLNKTADWQDLYALWLCDTVTSLAEATGAIRADYPEIEIDATLAAKDSIYDVDGMLDRIESVIGVELRFPNPFPHELGLRSRRGIIGFRSIQSAYQAWRIAQIAGSNPDFKVLEIGAGLGRTAYFARMFGVRNYTILDIPLTNAAQGYFLGRTVGPRVIELYNESSRGGLRILPSTVMASHVENYDLVVNVDSWTEMAPEIAGMYWNFARRSSKAVLSINHEFNPHTVRDLYAGDPGVSALRYPYPMRRGYMEETLTWR